VTDRVQVAFHPSLPEHARALMDTLDVEVVFDENAPTECPCGCKQAGHRYAQRVISDDRVDARAIAERTRARLRAQTCETHPTYRLTRDGGSVVCRACEREAVPASTGTV
jgi:hypothetical protein